MRDDLFKYISEKDLIAREGNGNPLQYSCLENPRDGGALQAAVHGVAESNMTEQFHFHFSLSCIGEGNSNPLQCSCLENPRDGGAWWAAISGVAQSRIRLKRLSSSSSSSSILLIHKGFQVLIRLLCSNKHSENLNTQAQYKG